MVNTDHLSVPQSVHTVEVETETTDQRTLLLIDNDPSHAELFRRALPQASDGPFQGESVPTLAAGIERLKKKEVWAAFVNLSLPDSQGLATFDELSLAVPGVPTLVVCDAEDEGLALEALRRGAKDYLLEDHVDAHAFVRAIRHMTERKTAEEALYGEKERAQVTLNSIGDAVLSIDVDGNVVYLNVVAEKLTGWTCKEALGRRIGEVFKIVDGDTREPCPNPLKAAISRNETVLLTPNCILFRRDGVECAIEDSAAPIRDRQGSVTGGVIVFHDVSKARAIGLEMSHLAQHDILTNLPNRHLLDDRLNHAIAIARRNGTRLAVLYLDLDGFKDINDSLGHAVGDKVLQSVATRLLACVRISDTVGRQGGDEFVVLLHQIADTKDAGVKAEKILAALTAPLEIDHKNLNVTVSIGVATYPGDGQDAETLIGNADQAMYRAKARNYSNYEFFETPRNDQPGASSGKNTPRQAAS